MEMRDMDPERRFVISNLEFAIRRRLKTSNYVVMRQARYDWGIGECFEPDVSILCDIQRRKKHCFCDVPQFVAEVLSDFTEDCVRKNKMKAYVDAGVEECWLVDWRAPGCKIERYMLSDDGEEYILHDTVCGKDTEDIFIITFQSIRFKIKDLLENLNLIRME